MLKISTLTSRARFIGAATILAGLTLMSALQPMLASAEQVSSRSMSLSSTALGNVGTTAPAGSALNGQKVSYTFRFTPATSGSVTAFSFMFCPTAFGYLDGSAVPRMMDDPCTGLTGFDASNAPVPTITGVTGAATWTVQSGLADNVLVVTASAAVTVSNATPVVISFPANATNFITNPTIANNYTSGYENTFFAHMESMSAYTDSDTYTTVDDGTMASATTQSIALTARVQETLKFSVGIEPTAPSTTCAPLGDGTANNNALTLGDPVNGALSTGTAYDAHSYFRVSTNAVTGTDIQYAGSTLTSGSQVIDAIGITAAASDPGVEQFGLALDSSDTQAGNGHAFSNLAPATNYSGGNGTIQDPGATGTFAFDTASSGTPRTLATTQSADIISCETGSVRYVANIATDTAAGIYRTSVNYIAVPKY